MQIVNETPAGPYKVTKIPSTKGILFNLVYQYPGETQEQLNMTINSSNKDESKIAAVAESMVNLANIAYAQGVSDCKEKLPIVASKDADPFAGITHFHRA